MDAAGTGQIVTARLRLRPYAIGDFASMRRLMTAPGSQLYPAREPMAEEEIWTRLLRHIGHWAALGFSFFAVEEKATGAFVGEAGCTLFRREDRSGGSEVPEATWTMIPECRGRGYATEAAGAALAWIERERGVRRTTCIIHLDNAASLAVARKLRYEEVRRVTYKDEPAIAFARVA